MVFFPPASFDASSLIFDLFCIFEGEGVALAFRSIVPFSASAPELSIGTMVDPVIIAGESHSAEKVVPLFCHALLLILPIFGNFTEKEWR